MSENRAPAALEWPREHADDAVVLGGVLVGAAVCGLAPAVGDALANLIGCYGNG